MSTPSRNVVAFGKVVSFYYGVREAGGRLLDRTAYGEPLTYLHGAGNLVPGLEKALSGKSSGDRVEVTLPPEEAYGVRDPAKTRTVPRAAVPIEGDLKVGSSFAVQSASGKVSHAHVVAVEADLVTFDLNHPYAGKTLTFDLSVADVRDATKDELAHGHPADPRGGDDHGPGNGGHDHGPGGGCNHDH